MMNMEFIIIIPTYKIWEYVR